MRVAVVLVTVVGGHAVGLLGLGRDGVAADLVLSASGLGGASRSTGLG